MPIPNAVVTDVVFICIQTVDIYSFTETCSHLCENHNRQKSYIPVFRVLKLSKLANLDFYMWNIKFAFDFEYVNNTTGLDNTA